MKRKLTYLNLAGLIIIAVVLASCSGLQKMTKNYETISYQVTPEVLETNGGKIAVSIEGNIPPKFFNTKAAIYFAPVLKYENDVTELKPILLKGEKVEGEGIEITYKNGGSFSYSDEINYHPDMNTSVLLVTPIVFMAKESLKIGETREDIMLKLKAAELGTTKLADGVIYTSTRIEVENEVREVIEIGEEIIERDSRGNILMEIYEAQIEIEVDLLKIAPHGYQKQTIVSESAKIYFAKNLYNFNKNLKLNKEHKIFEQLGKVNDFVSQGWKIRDIEINGWASPEGEESFNDGLSENRAITAEKYLCKQFKKIAREKDTKVEFKNPKTDINFRITGRGPDWNGFLNVVEKSKIKDKRPIVNVVKSSDPLKREQEIRNMINIYPELEEFILPPLRRSEITVFCYEPKKTDEEIARLATSNPKELTEEELLYAGTLTDEWNTQYRIYKAAMSNFPRSWKGFNNAGYVALKLGKVKEALKILEKAEVLSKNNGIVSTNLGVAFAYNKNYTAAEKYFINAEKMGVNNSYNLGVISITKGDYSMALKRFSGVKCNYNVALAQLLAGNNSGAAANLECARKNGATYYLLAVVGARTGNEVLMYANLKKSIKANPKYRKEAVQDRECIKYFETPEFLKATK